MQKALTGAIRLNPFAVEDKLRDSAFADVPKNLIGSAWNLLDVDLGVGNRMFVQKTFSLAAITAPYSGVDLQIHNLILLFLVVAHQSAVDDVR